MCKKKFQKNTQGNLVFVGWCKRKMDQIKFHFHLAMGKMFLPIIRRNLYIINDSIFALCQTKHLLTESKAVKGLFVQKSHKRTVG